MIPQEILSEVFKRQPYFLSIKDLGGIVKLKQLSFFKKDLEDLF